ncbi:Uncharacterised protein [Candidatus Norongarragalina meridionalis]|nr:Uncharacterised protein [Candidatus Norongarragalina meridionalis]
MAIRWLWLALLAVPFVFACGSLTVPYILCGNQSDAPAPCSCSNVTSCYYNLTWGQMGVIYIAVQNPLAGDMAISIDGNLADTIPGDGYVGVVQTEFVAPTEGQDCCLWKNHTVTGVNVTNSSDCWTANVATQIAFAPPFTPSPSTLPSPSPVACTAEAKICPDGSSVGRTGPNCEFAPCPSVAPSPSPTTKPSPSPKPTATPTPSSRPNQPIIVRVSPSPPAAVEQSPPDMLPTVMLLMVGAAVIVFLLIRKPEKKK